MNAGSEKGFIGVDVADADHHRLVHDEGFDADITPPRPLYEMVAAQSFERFRAKTRQ